MNYSDEFVQEAKKVLGKHPELAGALENGEPLDHYFRTVPFTDGPHRERVHVLWGKYTCLPSGG